jgi:hypothetical protein
MPRSSRNLQAIPCKRCGERFYICSSCYRGQRYCSEECRKQARRQQVREANRRYRQSQEVRLDHRDRQREYRRAKNSVRYQSSKRDPSDAMIALPEQARTTATRAAAESTDLARPLVREAVRQAAGVAIRCQICGFRSEFIDISTS